MAPWASALPFIESADFFKNIFFGFGDFLKKVFEKI